MTILCDVTQENQVKDAIELTIKTYGVINAALNCAAVAWITPTLTSKGVGLNTEDFYKMI